MTSLLDFNRSVSFDANTTWVPLSARQTWQRKFPILKRKHILVDIRLTHLLKRVESSQATKMTFRVKAWHRILYTVLLLQYATTWWPAAGGGSVLIHIIFGECANLEWDSTREELRMTIFHIKNRLQSKGQCWYVVLWQKHLLHQVQYDTWHLATATFPSAWIHASLEINECPNEILRGQMSMVSNGHK